MSPWPLRNTIGSDCPFPRAGAAARGRRGRASSHRARGSLAPSRPGRARNASAESKVSTVQPSSRSTRDSAFAPPGRRRRERWSSSCGVRLMRRCRTGRADAERRAAFRIVARGEHRRCAATIEWQIASPMPMPPGFVLQNASNTFLRSDAMPCPRSTTHRRTPASVASVRITGFVRRPRSLHRVGGVENRFSRTCCSCTRPPSTTGSDGARSVAAYDVAGHQLGAQQIERFANQLVEVERLHRHLAALVQRAEAANDLAARLSSVTMSSQISFSSARSTRSRASILRAASALPRIAASGWFSWCAMEAESWPRADTRERRASSVDDLLCL